MKHIYRLWLRLVLCEPEERAELTYSQPVTPDEVDRYLRRVRRYETAFGPFHLH